jgi:hypothetical protein
MQEWYEKTASMEQDQTETLQEQPDDMQLNLPQIDQEHKNHLEEEITEDEVEAAIIEAHEISAPGPSGQTITLYKLLFQELPNIFTAAVNQLVLNTELSFHNEFQWIRERKVIYIPKNSALFTLADYRPLSMLEVRYYTRSHQGFKPNDLRKSFRV